MHPQKVVVDDPTVDTGVWEFIPTARKRSSAESLSQQLRLWLQTAEDDSKTKEWRRIARIVASCYAILNANQTVLHLRVWCGIRAKHREASDHQIATALRIVQRFYQLRSA